MLFWACGMRRTPEWGGDSGGSSPADALSGCGMRRTPEWGGDSGGSSPADALSGLRHVPHAGTAAPITPDNRFRFSAV